MKPISITEELAGNDYPGRGILVGLTPDGKNAVASYFIMGRSENSRNRVFVEDGMGIKTQAFDPGKLADPSLIIYAPVRVMGDRTIVSNGDQTDTIYEQLEKGGTFSQALFTRTFEPDAPHYTPRISALLQVGKGNFSYQLSILKSGRGDPSSCERQFFSYEHPLVGEGRLLHTYQHDGDPLPSFSGEPRDVRTGNDLDTFAETLWESLDADNKISLFVRYISLADGTCKTKIINRNQ